MTANIQPRGIVGVAALSMRSASPSRPVASPAPLTAEEELRKQADALLVEWHAWAAVYRPPLGMPGCSPSSRQAQSSRQWQSTAELADESYRKTEMESVEWCVDSLMFQYRQAIGMEMRNRAAGVTVWRASTFAGVSYQASIEEIMPLMRRRGLLG